MDTLIMKRIGAAGLIALGLTACSTTPRENEARTCSGRDRRPVNLYASALPAMPEPPGSMATSDVFSAPPPTMILPADPSSESLPGQTPTSPPVPAIDTGPLAALQLPPPVGSETASLPFPSC